MYLIWKVLVCLHGTKLGRGWGGVGRLVLPQLNVPGLLDSLEEDSPFLRNGLEWARGRGEMGEGKKEGGRNNCVWYVKWIKKKKERYQQRYFAQFSPGYLFFCLTWTPCFKKAVGIMGCVNGFHCTNHFILFVYIRVCLTYACYWFIWVPYLFWMTASY